MEADGDDISSAAIKSEPKGLDKLKLSADDDATKIDPHGSPANSCLDIFLKITM